MEDSDYVEGDVRRNYLAEEVVKLSYVEQELMRPHFRCPECGFQTIFVKASTPYFRHHNDAVECEYLTRNTTHGEGEGTIETTRKKPTKIVLKFGADSNKSIENKPASDIKRYRNRRKFTNESPSTKSVQLSLRSALKRLINDTFDPETEIEIAEKVYIAGDFFINANKIKRLTRGYHGVWGKLESIKDMRWINFDKSILRIYSRMKNDDLEKAFKDLNEDSYFPKENTYLLIVGRIEANTAGNPTIYPYLPAFMTTLVRKLE